MVSIAGLLRKIDARSFYVPAMKHGHWSDDDLWFEWYLPAARIDGSRWLGINGPDSLRTFRLQMFLLWNMKNISKENIWSEWYVTTCHDEWTVQILFRSLGFKSFKCEAWKTSLRKIFEVKYLLSCVMINERYKFSSEVWASGVYDYYVGNTKTTERGAWISFYCA